MNLSYLIPKHSPNWACTSLPSKASPVPVLSAPGGGPLSTQPTGLLDNANPGPASASEKQKSAPNKCIYSYKNITASNSSPHHITSCSRSRLACSIGLGRGCRLLLLRRRRINWHQRMGWIVPDTLDDSKSFRPALAEQEPVTGRKVLRALHKTKRNRRTVASSYKRAIDVNDGAGLRDRSDVEHGLVLSLDGGCVRKDEDCSVCQQCYMNESKP